jgi:hypothetical protein
MNEDIVEKPEVNLEDAFQSLFKTSASGTGEEELLRIAATYSLQISARQIKALLWLHWTQPHFNERQGRSVAIFIDKWLEYKQHNNSDVFVMRALESISLRKFIGENAFKVNIEK